MTEKASRRGAVDLGTVLMIAAFAVIAGFIYWLSGQAAAERSLDIVEDSTSMVTDDPYAAAIPISASDIMADAGGYATQLVRLAPQTVLSLVGQQGFFLDFPTGPFLVSFSDEQRAEGLGIQTGDVVRIIGRVATMTEEIAAGWQEAGTVSEGEAIAVTVSSHYIVAEDIEVSAPAPAQSDGGA